MSWVTNTHSPPSPSFLLSFPSLFSSLFSSLSLSLSLSLHNYKQWSGKKKHFSSVIINVYTQSFDFLGKEISCLNQISVLAYSVHTCITLYMCSTDLLHLYVYVCTCIHVHTVEPLYYRHHCGPHEVSWLKRCPHFRGCLVYFSM